ncbi:hypothetical protein HJC23_008763 [Cyclotella cryptica]|uniref:O-fucosyltransferase family protein n=1 Tax=Cyclotella cryptica TaxID=29204 RepID=A0ABD3PCL6_9STRA
MVDANTTTPPPSSLGSSGTSSTNPSNKHAKPKPLTRGPNAQRSNASSQTYILFVLTCVFVTMTGNFLHHRIADPHSLHRRSMDAFKKHHLEGHNELAKKLEKEKQEQKEAAASKLLMVSNGTTAKALPPPIGHDLAGLSCTDHGGPSDELAAEMVYWEDIPSDSNFKSPIGANDKTNKYLTFEPDGGGFNNIRMSMETIVVMAHAMGRILVMPPAQNHYLLRKDRDKQRTHFSFNDFYHMEQVGFEHAGLEIITMEEFLLKEAMTGNLKDKETGKVMFPPYNRTDWNGQDPKELKEYLRNVTLTPLNWAPGSCLAAFPSDDGPEHFEELNGFMHELKQGQFPKSQDFVDNPVPVDAPPIERLKEAVAGQMRVRMLTHFYAFLFFEDWRQDLWSKRFVRDHLRYSDEIQCAAARVVAALRERARKRDPEGNPNGEFDSMHIRRGDFQYKETQITSDEIYQNSKDELKEGGTVFVATDHVGKPFFKPLADHYDLVFLKDFAKELEGVNTNYFGMVDQLVASRGRVFFGCYHSTFTGFIVRMRGYHSVRDKSQGYESGLLFNTYYYTGSKEKNLYQHYGPLMSPYYSREFPIAWRNIDYGIDELVSAATS